MSFRLGAKSEANLVGVHPDVAQAVRLAIKLTDIDFAPIVEVLERRISWDAADLSSLPKGRYRLLRDDV